MATTDDLRCGQVLDLDGELWSVVTFQHVKPGQGAAFARTVLRSVRSGTVIDRSFGAGTALDTATVERRPAQLSHAEDGGFVFVEPGGDRELPVPAAVAGDAARYLAPGTDAIIVTHRGEPLAVQLPTSVTLTVAAVAGAPGAATTAATLQTGITVEVPAAVVPGLRIRVDTRDGHYLGLA